MRSASLVAPMAALFFIALGLPVFGQSLFEGLPAAEKAEQAEQEELRGPLTAEQKAAGMRESIFWNTMKVGQVCSHGTAAILGLTGEDQREWTAWARKYNQAVNEATEQLFKDASAKLNPKQMELLKAWFAIGWNPQINKILYGMGLDNLDTAKIDEVKEMNPKRDLGIEPIEPVEEQHEHH